MDIETEPRRVGEFTQARNDIDSLLERVSRLEKLFENTDLVKSLRARISELESREPEIREVEKIVERVVEVPAAPIPLPPEPETTRLSDYGEVGDPADEITPDDLLNDMRRNGDGVRDVIAKLTSEKRRRFTELLNVELAELQQVRGRAGEDLKREAEIEKLLGLFARVGEI